MPNVHTPQRLPNETKEDYRARQQRSASLFKHPPLYLNPITAAIREIASVGGYHAHVC